MLLPCTYDVTISQGHLTIVLCGKFVTSPKHIGYVKESLENAGIHVNMAAKEVLQGANVLDG